jgi:Tfp pilus assembly protein PilF
MQRGDLDEAAAAVADLALRFPRWPQVHTLMGVLLLRRQQPSLAVAAFEQALEADPRLAMPHVRLAEAHQALGHPVDAAFEYREALRIDPHLARAHVALGILYDDQGEAGAADRQYRRAVESDLSALNPKPTFPSGRSRDGSTP